MEQHLTALQRTAFRADRQNPQRLLPRAAAWHPFEERDVVFDTHDYGTDSPPGYATPWSAAQPSIVPQTGTGRSCEGSAPFVVLTAPVCSRPLR